MLFENIIFFAFIAFAYSDCTYNIDVENKPIFAKIFGSRQVILTKNTGNVLSIKTDEIIEAFCENGFWHGCDGHIQNSHILLKCMDGSIYQWSAESKFEHQLYDDCNGELKCIDSSGFQLFESNRSLSNCDPNMSLGVGIQVVDSVQNIYAGICYDWNNMNLKYVHYMAYRSKSGFLTNTQAENILQINSVTLDDKLDHIQDYFDWSSLGDLILNQFDFESDSLVQDLPLKDDLRSFENLLQIIWWRNLRLGNWRTFLNLLEERSRNVPYNVIIGSSGEITMPDLYIECKMNKTLSYTSSNNERKPVPAFIWLYLKSTQSYIAEDLVVIAYNSPFYDNDPSTYLCQDICNEVWWLHSIHEVRKMPALGLIYCCRPEDVADKLNNFPYVIEESESTTTTEAEFNLPPIENEGDNNDIDDTGRNGKDDD